MGDANRFAILLDGGFLIKKLKGRLKRFPEAADIEKICDQAKSHPSLANISLLRVYFYHAPPAKGNLKDPAWPIAYVRNVPWYEHDAPVPHRTVPSYYSRGRNGRSVPGESNGQASTRVSRSPAATAFR